MSHAQRNAIVTVVAALAYYGWWRVANAYALARPDANDVVDPLILHALLDLGLGVGLYFAFVGSPIVRIVLTAVVPLLAGVLLEVTVGSDRAYPYIVLIFAGLIAVLFLVGALMAFGIDTWRKKGRASVA